MLEISGKGGIEGSIPKFGAASATSTIPKETPARASAPMSSVRLLASWVFSFEGIAELTAVSTIFRDFARDSAAYVFDLVLGSRSEDRGKTAI